MAIPIRPDKAWRRRRPLSQKWSRAVRWKCNGRGLPATQVVNKERATVAHVSRPEPPIEPSALGSGKNFSFSAPFAPDALCQRTLWDGIGGAPEQVGLPLVGVAADEADEVFEAHADRLLVERPVLPR